MTDLNQIEMNQMITNVLRTQENFENTNNNKNKHVQKRFVEIISTICVCCGGVLTTVNKIMFQKLSEHFL